MVNAGLDPADVAVKVVEIPSLLAKMFRVVKDIEDIVVSILNFRDELFAVLQEAVNLPCAVR